MPAWLDAVGLDEITLVGQDWGGLIGLRLVAARPDRFARVVAANTFLPTGEKPPNQAFARWREYCQTAPDFAVGRIVN
jgi:haloalkane dehalogenase